MHRLFLVHNSLTVAIREDTLYGRPHLVAPVVAVKAGVLNGELLTAQEISHHVEAWNNRPIVLTHPVSDKGAPVSANSKAVLEAMCFGQLLNCSFQDNGLQGELWIDLGRAEELGGDALLCVERLRSNQPIEVSTGYWCDPEPQSGTHEGITYNAIQHNLKPDHLALLPHDIGACSWENGCGAPRINVACTCQKQEEQKPVKANWLTKFVRLFRGPATHEEPTDNITQSFSDVENALYEALSGTMGNMWDSYAYIADVYKTYFVYCVSTSEGMGPYYWRDYSLDANGVATLGAPEEVVREVRYTPVKPTANAETDPPAQETEPETVTAQQQGDDMDKKQMVAAIMKANQMEAAAEAGLLLLNEEQLTKLLPVAEPPKKEDPKQQSVQPQAPQLTQEQQDAAYVLNSFADIAKQERTGHIAFLTANSPFTAEQLAVKSLEELRTLRQMADQSVAANYLGRSFPQTNQEQKPGAPDIKPVFDVGVGWVDKSGNKIAGTPTFE